MKTLKNTETKEQKRNGYIFVIVCTILVIIVKILSPII